MGFHFSCQMPPSTRRRRRTLDPFRESRPLCKQGGREGIFTNFKSSLMAVLGPAATEHQLMSHYTNKLHTTATHKADRRRRRHVRCSGQGNGTGLPKRKTEHAPGAQTNSAQARGPQNKNPGGRGPRRTSPPLQARAVCNKRLSNK